MVTVVMAEVGLLGYHRCPNNAARLVVDPVECDVVRLRFEENEAPTDAPVSMPPQSSETNTDTVEGQLAGTEKLAGRPFCAI